MEPQPRLQNWPQGEGDLAMCGIAGWIGTLPDGERYAARMAQALRRRGPDACRSGQVGGVCGRS